VDEKTLNLKMIRLHLASLSIEKDIKDKFMLRLYMSIPHMFLNSNEAMSSSAICQEILKDSSGSIGDKWTHTMITTIASLTNTRDFQGLSSDTELALRKFAASHPTLLLRELSLIASLLAGRGHMDMHVLRQEHHIAFFNQMLSIMDLLQPMIFEDIYMSGLHKALQCYFSLLQNHSREGSLYGMIYRISEFVRSYAAANPSGAFILINNNIELFTELMTKNKGCFPLQQIMSSLQFLAKGISVPALTAKQENNLPNSVSKLGNPSNDT
jgi:integrator complex subunit 1